jgi:hypothetical protein
MHRFVKWREALNLAPSAAALDGVMRDYVDTLAPLLAVLPEDCRRALAPPIDIQWAAVTLMQAELRCEGSADSRALLHEVAHTFAAAALRVTQLHVARRPTRTPEQGADGPAQPATD